MKTTYTVPNCNELITILTGKLQTIQNQIKQFMLNGAIKDSILLDTTIGLNFIKKYQMKQILCLNEQSKGWCEFGNNCWYKHNQLWDINQKEKKTIFFMKIQTHQMVMILNNNMVTLITLIIII